MRIKTGRFAEQSRELRNAIKRIEKQFNLTLTEESANACGLQALFQNAYSGVEFEFSPQESGWRVLIGRLADGKLPTYPIYVNSQTVLNLFDLRDVAAIRLERIPELTDKIDHLDPLTVSEICLVLERCCADIFQGDFSSFAALRDRVMKRLPTSTS